VQRCMLLLLHSLKCLRPLHICSPVEPFLLVGLPAGEALLLAVLAWLIGK